MKELSINRSISSKVIIKTSILVIQVKMISNKKIMKLGTACPKDQVQTPI